MTAKPNSSGKIFNYCELSTETVDKPVDGNREMTLVIETAYLVEVFLIF